jgi:3-hydroxy-4-methylanthranilate adenylyltransferase
MEETQGRALVDDLLLAGRESNLCLSFEKQLTVGDVRAEVREQDELLHSAGIGAGTVVALRMPPSARFVTALLALLRRGAQVVLVDHRLTPFEVDRALDHLRVQAVVTGADRSFGALQGYQEGGETVIRRRPGHPARTGHVLVQLSSGSTGPAKVIGRTASDLAEEVGRYARIDGMPAAGEQVVVLSSLSHTWGLVGGLLQALHVGAVLSVPDRLTVDGVVSHVAGARRPVTVLAVPLFASLLSTGPSLHGTALRQIVSAGDVLPTRIADDFADRHGVRVGEVYGMTETGILASDLSGTMRPDTGRVAPGVDLRVDDGELLVARPAAPYLDPSVSERWADGWLRTKDAGTYDPLTRVVRVLGRMDSQVAVGGLKVDLTEVEHTLRGAGMVTELVVAFDRQIEAFAVLAPGFDREALETAIDARLAPFKRPRRLHLLRELPRTSTGKPIRELATLRAAASGEPA